MIEETLNSKSSILVIYSSTIDLNLTLPSSFLSLLLQLRSSYCHPFLSTGSVKEQHLFRKIFTSHSHLRTWKWISSLLAAIPNYVENDMKWSVSHSFCRNISHLVSKSAFTGTTGLTVWYTQQSSCLRI